MSSEESREFVGWRRDLEAQEAFKADDHRYKRQYTKIDNRINEQDPRDRD